jgi:hypothetical protein
MHIRVGENGGEVGKRQVEDAEPVHHRVGVGQRSKQQHRHRIGDQESEHHEQRG